MIVSQRLSLRTPANFMESHAEPEDLLNIPWRHPDKIGRDTILHELRAICRFDAGRVLDVGSGDTGYRDLFEQRFKSFVTLDLKHAARPNVAGSAMALPFRSESFDTIISTCMLEHVPAPFTSLLEMNRVLRRGGRLVLAAPQSWPIHLQPNDFYRFTRYGLEEMLKRSGFEVEEMRACGDYFATLGQVLAHGAIQLGTRARHSRTRRFWRRRVLPIINRIFLRLDKRGALGDGNVLDWAVLARRPLDGSPQSRGVAAELL